MYAKYAGVTPKGDSRRPYVYGAEAAASGQKAGSGVDSHTVAHCILCSRQLTYPSTSPVLRRPILICLAAILQHTWATPVPVSVPMVMCALSAFSSMSEYNYTKLRTMEMSGAQPVICLYITCGILQIWIQKV